MNALEIFRVDGCSVLKLIFCSIPEELHKGNTGYHAVFYRRA